MKKVVCYQFWRQRLQKQVYISVGCVPPASWPNGGGGGICIQGGSCIQRGCIQGSLHLGALHPGGRHPGGRGSACGSTVGQTPLPVNRMTHRCKIITLLSQGVHVFPWKVHGPGDDNSESIKTLKVYCPCCTTPHCNSIVIQEKPTCITWFHKVQQLSQKLIKVHKKSSALSEEN